ncbi:hypothetical protein TVAG_071420 [Trichomonas vaginalis G3]|uniref:Uncharacterized protein n=1 Tax=Trichomonas vaginalis (strain ATCC PRA-98 / G3) TaxID=412133 RepID=A2D845_TRIV3|nr:protein ubiquitination [Trichomonas vaginalis G3]EAY23478.1 hypothetical protein TVAG_071420 [Trichomonas vaginalis G3]KAI5493895.1 protein ubiquitination [Trichomonas vaginalis G3]|eukprot:XP_001584464.1 hypothetical protein [Trichomonas vaginalis G3]
MKYSKLTSEQYITLLKQSRSTINAKELYICTRKANVTIQNYEEVISILQSIKQYMKFNIIDSIIDFLIHKDKEMRDSKEEIRKHQKELTSFQRQNKSNGSPNNQINENDSNSKEFLTKISEVKNLNDFESVYKFLDELSLYGIREFISKACEEGLWKIIKEEPMGNYIEEMNVLHMACSRGNLRLVKSLIECNCDIEGETKFGSTPLILASSRGHLEIVKYLISVGADKEARNNDGFTPVIIASYECHLEVVKYLISVGANKEAKTNTEFTPLLYASHNGHLEVVKYLISVGADKEAKTKFGSTPLILASSEGHLEVVKYLIFVNADKEVKDDNGETPLIHASKNGHLEVVKYLISVGADKGVKDNNGKTLLSFAKGIVWMHLRFIGVK